MNSQLPSLTILGVRVACLSRAQALEELSRLHGAGTSSAVAFVNAHTLNLASRDSRLREALNRAALVLNDGAGLSLAARMQGARFPDNLNGTDLTPELLTLAAERGWSVFLLGARPGIAEKAAAELKERHPGLAVAGVQDGYFPLDKVQEVKATIRASGASVLVVAMGNPLQEIWLDEHLEETGCRLGVGVGAFLDFAAGVVPRAPAWIRRAGIEWVYRLSQEPRRMWRRYVAGNPAFVLRLLMDRMRPRT
jgi:exopolysaccharide biosynthesis WecB/TagA/CpsF family protein